MAEYAGQGVQSSVYLIAVRVELGEVFYYSIFCITNFKQYYNRS